MFLQVLFAESQLGELGLSEEFNGTAGPPETARFLLVNDGSNALNVAYCSRSQVQFGGPARLLRLRQPNLKIHFGDPARLLSQRQPNLKKNRSFQKSRRPKQQAFQNYIH